MPYKLKKIRNKNLYKVYNSITGKIHSKGTTLDNAKAQMRLLSQLEGNGFNNEYYDYPKIEQSLTGNGIFFRLK